MTRTLTKMTVPAPRQNKFTYRSPPDFQNPLDHSSQVGPSQPVNMWCPRASQPVEENQPAFYNRYAPQGGPATQGVFLQPPRAHGGQPRFNPFSMANLPQQPYVQEEIPGPSHQQPHPYTGPSPAHRTSYPRHDFSEYNQF